MTHIRMSLVFMVWNGFELDPLFYKCAEDDVQPTRVERTYWGLWFLTSGVLILLLYTPCLIVIARHDLIKTASYKTMLVLAIYDILSTLVHSIATGILGLLGITFCDAPRLIFTLGAVGMGSWMGCCVTSMTLAVIRISEMSPKFQWRWVFEGWSMNAWLAVFWLYGGFGTFLSNPVLFSPQYMSWFFDPAIGRNPEIYINYAHTFNNIAMAVCTTVFYSFLCYIVLKKAGSSNSNKLSATQITTVVQTFFFCIFHAIGAVLYAYMQFFAAPPSLILVGQVAWQTSSASVALVYLTLNKTIRKAVIRLMCPCWKSGQVAVMVVSVTNAMTS